MYQLSDDDDLMSCCQSNPVTYLTVCKFQTPEFLPNLINVLFYRDIKNDINRKYIESDVLIYQLIPQKEREWFYCSF